MRIHVTGSDATSQIGGVNRRARDAQDAPFEARRQMDSTTSSAPAVAAVAERIELLLWRDIRTWFPVSRPHLHGYRMLTNVFSGLAAVSPSR